MLTSKQIRRVHRMMSQTDMTGVSDMPTLRKPKIVWERESESESVCVYAGYRCVVLSLPTSTFIRIRKDDVTQELVFEKAFHADEKSQRQAEIWAEVELKRMTGQRSRFNPPHGKRSK